MKPKYALAFMDMACRFGETSEATRLKVGALIVKDNAIISLGINGTPKGWHTNKCENSNNETEWFVKHAEIQALNKLRNSTETAKGSSMFCSHACCMNCAIDIVDAGIVQFYYRDVYRCDKGLKYLRDNGVKVVKI